MCNDDDDAFVVVAVAVDDDDDEKVDFLGVVLDEQRLIHVERSAQPPESTPKMPILEGRIDMRGRARVEWWVEEGVWCGASRHS